MKVVAFIRQDNWSPAMTRIDIKDLFQRLKVCDRDFSKYHKIVDKHVVRYSRSRVIDLQTLENSFILPFPKKLW